MDVRTLDAESIVNVSTMSAQSVDVQTMGGGGGGDVTKEAIIAALGYTPADDTDMTAVELTVSNKVSGIKPGGYAEWSKDANGVVTVPIATSRDVGVIKAVPSLYAVEVENGGSIKASVKSADEYASMNSSTFVGKGTLDNVLAAGELKLIETITYNGSTTAIYRNVTPDGAAYNFSEFVLVWEGNGSNVVNTAVVQANGSRLWASDRVMLGYTYSDQRVRAVAEYSCLTGVFRATAAVAGSLYSAAASTLNVVGGVSSITALEINTNGATPVAGATLKIYARWK